MSTEHAEFTCQSCRAAFQLVAPAGPVRFCPHCGAVIGKASASAALLQMTRDAYPADRNSVLPSENLEATHRQPSILRKISTRRRAAGITQILNAIPESTERDERVEETPGGEFFKPGTTIANCRVVGLLGKGGMGQVYEVEWMGAPGAPVVQALKVLHPKYVRHRAYVERFLQEAALAAQLDHANVIKTYDSGFADGMLYIRMDCLKQGTLRGKLKPGTRMPLESAAHTILQIGEGLACAHAHGIVHRDVKPENVLVALDGSDWRFILSDFGLVKELGAQLPDPVLSIEEFQIVCDVIARELNRIVEGGTNATQSERLVNVILEQIDKHAVKNFEFKPLFDPRGAYTFLDQSAKDATVSIGICRSECLGTPTYMPPEQIEGRRTDERSDIFALGTIFFELIAGEPPFKGATVSELITRKLTEPVPPLTALYPPSDWERVDRFARIIDFMMEKDRRRRYRRLRYCLDDIRRALSGKEPWCSNSRFIYSDATRNETLTEGEKFKRTEHSTLILLNLLQAVFEMSDAGAEA